MSFDYYIIN